MFITNEREVKSYEMDIDLDTNEFQKLREYGLKRIALDSQSLVNYAVNQLLMDYVTKQKALVQPRKTKKKNTKANTEAKMLKALKELLV
jgi:hypothetical protein